MSHDLDPPPSIVELVKNQNADSIWKKWFNNLYEKIKELVAEEVQKTAFGEQSVAEATPIFQADFSYNVNSDVWHDHSNNGAATVDSHQLKISTGAAANQSAEIQSRESVKYQPGQGGLVRVTGIFTTGAANSKQLIGVGDANDGFFFGYNGADFGVLRRKGGHREIRTLTITTGSSTAENITVTMDGDTDATVAVTASGDTDVTANEIAAHDFTNLGRGWEAHSDGDGTVTFMSLDAVSHSGSYSVSGTTAVGTFAQDLAGLAATDTWILQTAWSHDKGNGQGELPVMDWTKGNIFQIRYQWLGYGLIAFWIENPSTGLPVKVHQIEYANANTSVSVNNPALPICYLVENTSNTSDIVLNSGSVGAFVEGKEYDGHAHHGAVASRAGVDTTEAPVVIIHNPLLFEGVPNRVRVKIITVSVSVDGTKNCIFRLRRDATLTGVTYSDVEANVSVMQSDETAAAAISGGDSIFPAGLSKDGGEIMDLSTSSFFINPGETLAGTVMTVAGTTDAIVSIDWEEQF